MKGSSHERRNDRKGLPTSVDLGSLADDLNKLFGALRPSPYHRDRQRASSPVAAPRHPQGRNIWIGRTMNNHNHDAQCSTPTPTPTKTPRSRSRSRPPKKTSPRRGRSPPARVRVNALTNHEQTDRRSQKKAMYHPQASAPRGRIPPTCVRGSNGKLTDPEPSLRRTQLSINQCYQSLIQSEY
jgi:hypothetical protein